MRMKYVQQERVTVVVPLVLKLNCVVVQHLEVKIDQHHLNRRMSILAKIRLQQKHAELVIMIVWHQNLVVIV